MGEIPYLNFYGDDGQLVSRTGFINSIVSGTDLEAAEKALSCHFDTQWRNPYRTDNPYAQ